MAVQIPSETLETASEDRGWLSLSLTQTRVERPSTTLWERSRGAATILGLEGVQLSARAGRLGTRAALALALPLLLGVLGLMIFRAAYAERVYPAVSVGGVAVGGLEEAEARARLEQRAAALEAGLVTFAYGDQTWTPTMAELGATIDIDASLDAAYAVGRDGDAGERLGQVWDLVDADQTIPFQVTLDHAALDRWFDRVDGDLGIRPHDAYLVVEDQDVSIQPEVEGIVVDRAASRARVTEALVGLSSLDAPLPVTERKAAVRAGDLEAAKTQVESALQGEIDVTFGDQSWAIAAEDLGPFLRQTADPAKSGAAAVILGLDEDAVAAWLADRFAGEVNRQPVNAEVGWNGERAVAVSESVEGYRLQPKSFARDLEASFFGEHAAFEIPTSVLEPEADSDNLDALGITTHLARADSNFSGGTHERTVNVNIGTSLLNNTLVPPHKEFSLNGAIGEITADKGYLEASVVVGERAGRDIGGGICQVSTTVFRAALRAGVPITEWWAHTYRIPSYEWDGWGPGYDASILQMGSDPAGWSDFKFLNPTDSWMLVEAWTVDDIFLIVNIYGPDLGYDVRFGETYVSDPISEPENIEVVNDELPSGTITQTEWPYDGYEVAFTRDVYGPDGEPVESREFYTRFHGRGNVYQVSPDMAGLSPAA